MLEIAKVTTNSQPMTGAHLIWLEAPQIAQQAKPGQFVMVRCGENDEHPLRRPFSIALRESDKIALLLNVVGDGTKWLSQHKSGDKLDILGPLGNGFTIDSGSQNLLMIAGGIGIAPLCFLVEEVIKQGLSIKLLYGATTAAQLYPHLPEGIDVIYATEDGSTGKKGMITDLLPDFIDNADQLFACGPLAMYRTMAKMSELKNKSVQISLEVRMGCGVGVCYGCTVNTRDGLRQVCQDGPVLELNNVLWDKLND